MCEQSADALWRVFRYVLRRMFRNVWCLWRIVFAVGAALAHRSHRRSGADTDMLRGALHCRIDASPAMEREGAVYN